MTVKKSGFRTKALKFGKAAKAKCKAASKKTSSKTTATKRPTSANAKPRASLPTEANVAAATLPDSSGELRALLQKAAELFADVASEKKLLFTLGYKKGIWQFEVVNAWQLWFEKSLQSEFRASTPEAAVAAFLQYVNRKKIDPGKLTSPD